MKTIILLSIICLFTLYGCKKNKNNEDLKADIVQLKSDNVMLKKNLEGRNFGAKKKVGI